MNISASWKPYFCTVGNQQKAMILKRKLRKCGNYGEAEVRMQWPAAWEQACVDPAELNRFSSCLASWRMRQLADWNGTSASWLFAQSAGTCNVYGAVLNTSPGHFSSHVPLDLGGKHGTLKINLAKVKFRYSWPLTGPTNSCKCFCVHLSRYNGHIFTSHKNFYLYGQTIRGIWNFVCDICLDAVQR